MSSLNVATFQYDIAWESPDKNLDYIHSRIDFDTDLLILPEMFTTGFSMDPERLAVAMDNHQVDIVQQIANEFDMYIMGSMIISDRGHYFNRLILFSPDLSPRYYDKRHLFTYGTEDQHYASGNQDGIFEIGDWKICARVCYDLRFPVWSRNVSDYDLLVYVANWPLARQKAWDTLLLARAIENQSYVIGVNRVGTDGNGLKYGGGSAIINYRGDILTHARDEERIDTQVLIMDSLRDFRSKYPFLKDRDHFTIH
ncbi:MAG: amidohydrolase [Bacteroidia bacterium]|nr:amidohydrolase [Bacteroidia bacterium]